MAAALLAGCGQPVSVAPGAVAPAPDAESPAPAPAAVTKEIPPESLPPDPKTLARIKEAFAKTPVRPLPKDADVSQSLRRPQTRADFWRHVFLDGFRAQKSGDAAQTAAAGKFLEGYCLRISDSPDAPATDDLLKQGEQLYEAGVRDPHVCLPLAAILFDSQQGSSRLADVFKTLDEAFAGDKYSPWLSARFHRLKEKFIRSDGDKTGGRRREQMQFIINDLFRAAADPGLTNIQRRMLVQLLAGWAAEFPKGEFRVALSMKLDSAKNIDPWVREILLTRFYNAVAWDTRTGFMTQDRWERYEHYMVHARRHGLKAWELRPELPEAARELLNITMGTNKGAAGEDVRFWFDEAVQADFNYLDVYLSLAWALRPRWNGSHDKMIAFGDECLATGRFDTDVPFMYHQMVNDIVEERGAWGPLLEAPGIYERYVVLFEGLAKNAKSDAARNRQRARLAAVSYAAGKNDKAREILSELKSAVDPQDFALFNLPLDEVRNNLEIK
jgi:hypothetical protein